MDQVDGALERLAGVNIQLHLGLGAFGDARELTFGHVDHQLHGLDLRHGEDGLRAVVHVAIVIVTGRDDATDGARQRGVTLQVAVGRFAHIEARLRGLPLRARHAAHLIQFVDAAEVGAQVLHLQLLLAEAGGIHLHECLPAAHTVAHLDIDTLDTYGHRGRNVVRDLRLDRGGVCLHLLHLFSHGSAQLHLREGFLLRLFGLFSSARTGCDSRRKQQGGCRSYDCFSLHCCSIISDLSCIRGRYSPASSPDRRGR